MITFHEAYAQVLDNSRDFGKEKVALKSAMGRVLAEDVVADRDFPPFNRSTKDGIAVNFIAIEAGENRFPVKGILAAGQRPIPLNDPKTAMEIMTGAMVPEGADTIIMFEDIKMKKGVAYLNKRPARGANIHVAGSDAKKGDLLLPQNTLISAGTLGVLASVGIARPWVKKLPRMLLISTGDELVGIDQKPMAHQVRTSNIYSLYGALAGWGILPMAIHLQDDMDIIRQKLAYAMQEMDVLMISGGVSRGKFDFIPDILLELGVKQVFHNILQKPGKPFWFGLHKKTDTVIFSFPGNPVSTFLCYHAYFIDWLRKSLGLPIVENSVCLGQDITPHPKLTLFKNVTIESSDGAISAKPVEVNGSGDLTSLSHSDGFIRLDSSEEPYTKGMVVPFIPCRKLFE